MSKAGYVYILTNPCFLRPYIRLVALSRSVLTDPEPLHASDLPRPLEPYASCRTVHYKELFERFTKALPRRDFKDRLLRNGYRYSSLLFALHTLCDLSATYSDAEVYKYPGGRPVPFRANRLSLHGAPVPRAARFHFSMVGLKPGTPLTFLPDPSRKITVSDDTHIAYEGKPYSLTALVRLLMPADHRSPSNSYQGTHYILYQGDTLQQLRERVERSVLSHGSPAGSAVVGDASPAPPFTAGATEGAEK